ncbi:amino acid ABC transporter permease [Verminephrobacter aporrectodeae subsp. tuberculatae]|uniref:amino acid ABC transporter permease n=1 Tax=Verminephrobacter aporrectodeae TaxID=1110389 RepID=UPI002244298C|nr:amino acid ABC transporter permease [Verminephrobacter aporrectodeae]MCW8205520.1 amino acid ABC transporter permease [Verminephrobacter aporrectodeae subsp. tuberculatae]
MAYVWDFKALEPYAGLIGRGLLVTIAFTLSTVLAGLVLGLAVAVVRTNAPRWLHVPVIGYVELFRCTPLLVQLVWMYYALPVLVGVEMSPAMACFLALSLYAGSFYAEVFRGGIEAVDRAQWEAGMAVGMRRGRIFRRIVLPQAVRMMIPAFINQTVLQLKNTSLVSTIAVGDLLYQGAVITAALYRPLEVYTVIAVLYFAVLYPLTVVAQRVERRLGVHR